MFDPLLGFLVLTAGLWVPLTFLIGGFLAVVFVTRRMTKTRQKLFTGTITALVIILIPTWDVIAGRMYFHHICARDSGIKVYKRVKVERDLVGESLPEGSVAYERSPIAKRYPYSYDSSENLPGPAVIKFSREYVRDGQTDEVLGTLTMFFYGGGCSRMH